MYFLQISWIIKKSQGGDVWASCSPFFENKIGTHLKRPTSEQFDENEFCFR